jgi:hemerythrin-like domain-containing protein
MDRRSFLITAGVSGLAISARAAEKEPEVSPAEDLMREHGVLQRVLLTWEAALPQKNWDLIVRGAKLIRRFIEDYHEKLEEAEVFPRLEKAKRELETVRILRAQHDRGRAMTSELLTGKRDDRVVQAFIHMYRPHAAREDTVVFPAFHEIVGDKTYRELGDKFEEKEHQLLGKEGFEGAVKEVAELERAAGIADLSKA